MAKNNIENIKNYAKEIETLKDFVTAVRKLPGMYIGRKGNDGFLNMIREVYQNSIDEMMKDSSPCDRVSVSYNEITKEVIVSDNGRGIPFSLLDKIFSNQHTSSNYTKKKGEYSSGLHGVGAKVTNALSEYFIAESYINIPGTCDARRIEFYDGYVSDKGVYKIPNNGKQGTIVRFKVSEEVMGKITLPASHVLELVQGILYLTKIGSIVEFSYTDKNNKSHSTVLVNEKGIESIIEKVYYNQATPLIEPIKINDDTGFMKADIRIVFDSKGTTNGIIGYSNYCPTSGGTHMDGLIEGTVRYFRDYMNKIYLKDSNSKRKNKITISAVDIKTGLISIISSAHLNPIFTGQAKDILSNEDMFGYVKDLTMNALAEWSSANSSDLLKVCKHLKSLAEIRLMSEGEKVKLADRYKSSTLSKGLPDKYVPPTGNKNLELIICEGDSAAGSFKNSRCHERQGIFPIRGKIKNAIGSNRKDVLKNAEVAGILSIIGANCGTKNFDINKVKWDKIIFATDADADGGHISCLLLNMILMYCPELIEAGKVYKAIPPLYGIEQSKNKTIYLVDNKAYLDHVHKIFVKDNNLCNHEGIKLDKAKVSDLLYTNIDYTFYVNKVAKAYSVNPRLLELMCIVNIENGFKFDKKTLTKVDKKIKSMFRFVKTELINDRLFVSGLIDNKTNTLYMNDQLISACEEILVALHQNPYIFTLNDEMVTLYQLMDMFDKLKPKNITRYKGLGEMNPDKLAESTLHPDMNRTLIRYTMSSAKTEIDTIIGFENNKKEIIKDVKIDRHDLV